MKKEDLTYGNVLETKEGNRYLYHDTNRQMLYNINGSGYICLCDYNANLKHELNNAMDIVKVYEDYTCTKLLWERKEKPELTEDEIRKLNSLKELGFNYIARNEDGVFCAFDLKPQKSKSYWYSDCSVCDTLHICTTNNLFQFIQWSDDKPYSIEELLNEQ